MKECKYCRSIYDDSLSICPNCGGNKIITAQERMEEEELSRKEKENQQKSAIEPKKQIKKLAGILVGIIVVIIAAISISSYLYNHGAVNGDLSRADMAAAYEQGMLYYENKDYSSAIAELSKISSESKYYNDAMTTLENATFIFCSDAISTAATYARNEDYKTAYSIIKKALHVVPEDSSLTTELASYRESYKDQLRNFTLESTNGYIANGDYPSAIQAIQATLEELSGDIELDALYDKYKGEYLDLLIGEADVALENDGYEVAIDIVNRGLALLPNDTTLLGAINRYEGYKPVYLLELDYFSGTKDEYLKIVDTEQDNMGNAHYDCITNSVHRTYVLNGEYRRMTASFYQSYNGRSQSAHSMGDPIHLKIIGDDEILYSKYLENGASGIDPISIDVSLQGISRIEIDFSGYAYGWGPMMSLADMCLYP